LRVPSAQFGAVYDQIQSLSKNVTQQKQTGQDVTEEFIDLEAHIKTQKALEAQFLEIMKQAHKVETHWRCNVRSPAFAQRLKSSKGATDSWKTDQVLSTITVNLKPVSAIVVNSSGFGRSVKEAISESIEVSGDLILFLIRFVIVMIPIFVLIILPLGLVAGYFVRRARRIRLARDLTEAWNPQPQLLD